MVRKLLLIFALLPGMLQGQQLLFSEGFEGPSFAFDLNTVDVGSTAGGDNTWLVNNVYAGGSGSVVCLGFPLPFSVATTAAQPAAISTPNGNYMHTTSSAALASGVQNCCFLAADGLCANAANHFVRMNTDVSTVGANDVTLSFWWLCGGGANSFGEVYYSTDAGASWNLITAPIAQYRNQASWVQQNITLPAFSGQATIRFGFRFVNGTTTSAQDPGFGVDDIRLTSAGEVPASVSTGAASPVQLCPGSSMNVPYTAAGPFNVGNTFTVELSDLSGSFATATVIGSVVATSSGTISCTIPFGTPAGTNYRVRVLSSDPVLVGTEGPAVITVSDAPFAGADGTIALCKNTGTYDLFQFLGAEVSTCGVWTGPGGTPFSGIFDTDTQGSTPFTYTTICPGACPQDEALLTVMVTNPANTGQDVDLTFCDAAPPVSLVGYVSGGDPTGLFYYQGQTNPLPDLSVPGSYTLDYVVFGTGPCPNDSAVFNIVVNASPFAGNNATATICSDSAPVDLSTFVGGDAGGTWLDPSGDPFSGILDPGVGLSGLYTYSVAGVPPCTNALAVVAVVIDPCTSVQETDRDTGSIRWLGGDGEGHWLDLGAMRLEGLTLFDRSGRLLGRMQASGDRGLVKFPMDGFATGIYVLEVRTQAGAFMIRLFNQAH
jgi:hypothetical protein